MFGFIVNTLTVLAGGTLGVLAGGKLADKYKSIVLHALGLITVLIGIRMALKTNEVMIVVASMVVGGLIGQWLHIEEGLERIGEYLKKRSRSEGKDFVLGFVTASLLFCVGPMTVVGSFEDGLYGKGELIYIKSIMDGFAGMALAAALGPGVIFSAIFVFIYQGALTILARYFQNLLSEPVVTEMSATGGVILLGIAANLLGLSKIKVGNFLPALVLAAVIAEIVK
jgi:uncharacterized membrane protein YqgA involved in biofilm formation